MRVGYRYTPKDDDRRILLFQILLGGRFSKFSVVLMGGWFHQTVGNLVWSWETSLKSRGGHVGRRNHLLLPLSLPLSCPLVDMYSLKMKLISFVGKGTHTHTQTSYL